MERTYSSQKVFAAGTAATETKTLDEHLCRSAAAMTLRVDLTGFSGTIDIQGRPDADNDWMNLITRRSDGTSLPTTGQITTTTITGNRDYRILNPMPYMRVVMTRSAGSIESSMLYASEQDNPIPTAGVARGGAYYSHFPAANAQATIGAAAAPAGFKNVCTQITVTFAAGATAPAAIQVNAKLIDGASGGGTILWGGVFALPAVAGASTGASPSGWWEGTAATAMTLEFNAAGGANTIEAVSMTVIQVPV